MPPKAAKGKKPAAAAAAPGPAAALLAAAASTRLQWAPAPGAAGPSTLPPPVVQAEYGTADDDLVRVGPQLGVELLPPHRRGGRAAPAAAPSPAEAPAAAAPAAAGEPDDDEQPDGARIPDLDDSDDSDCELAEEHDDGEENGDTADWKERPPPVLRARQGEHQRLWHLLELVLRDLLPERRCQPRVLQPQHRPPLLRHALRRCSPSARPPPRHQEEPSRPKLATPRLRRRRQRRQRRPWRPRGPRARGQAEPLMMSWAGGVARVYEGSQETVCRQQGARARPTCARECRRSNYEVTVFGLSPGRV